MSLLVATWIGALTTVGLLVGAAFTAWYARKAFREQSKEVKILQQQAKRDIDDRLRRQAATFSPGQNRVLTKVIQAHESGGLPA